MAQTRITAGQWRGRIVGTQTGMRIRPTRSMVRESLFNILGGRVDGARVLDLYAGAGTLGFEALSRQAATATFVDRDPAEEFVDHRFDRRPPAEAIEQLRVRGQRGLALRRSCLARARGRDDQRRRDRGARRARPA